MKLNKTIQFISAILAASILVLSLASIWLIRTQIAPSSAQEAVVDATYRPLLLPTQVPVQIEDDVPAPLAHAFTKRGTPEKDCQQLILVQYIDHSTCQLYAYQKGADGKWEEEKSCSGYLGLNGVTMNKNEGDGCTPLGTFSLTEAFGVEDKPGRCKLPYRVVTRNVYWVDDPASPHYNQMVDETVSKDWISAQRLDMLPQSYAYAVVIDYNRPDAQRNKGSAVFLHCSPSPSMGSVTIPKSYMLWILNWLDPSQKPKIIITD